MGVKTVEDLAQKAIEAQKTISSTRRVPSEGATSEEWRKFYQALGAPESPDGYALPDDNAGPVKTALERAREAAFRRGVTKEAWDDFRESLVGAHSEAESQRRQQLEQQVEQWKERASGQFGENLEDVKTRAHRALARVFGDNEEARQLFEAQGLGEHPGFLGVMSQLDSFVNDDTIPPANTPPQPTEGDKLMKAREIALKMKEIVAKPEFHDRRQAGHDVALENFYSLSHEIQQLGFSGATDPALRMEELVPYPNTPTDVPNKAPFGL